MDTETIPQCPACFADIPSVWELSKGGAAPVGCPDCKAMSYIALVPGSPELFTLEPLEPIPDLKSPAVAAMAATLIELANHNANNGLAAGFQLAITRLAQDRIGELSNSYPGIFRLCPCCNRYILNTADPCPVCMEWDRLSPKPKKRKKRNVKESPQPQKPAN